MKSRLTIALLFLFNFAANGQFNPLTTSLVYQEPAMEKAIVKNGLVFNQVHPDTLLKMDVYYPPDLKTDRPLPVVIFNNGVGTREAPQWKIYRDWARLIAARGMIAINHHSRPGKTKEDLRSLLQFLAAHGASLHIDGGRVAIWTCSANAQTGWPVANDPSSVNVKAVAVYYGAIPVGERIVRRDDLEVLLVRAGLDSYFINQAYEELTANALASDAHIELINYPTGQHAFDAFDNTVRSKEIILQTVDFFRRNLLGDNADAHSGLMTNRQFWSLALGGEIDESVAGFRKAFAAYRARPEQLPSYNQLLNENNITTLAYELLGSNRTDDAMRIFQLYAEAFPNSPNAYDGLADGYEQKGELELMKINAALSLKKLEGATGISPAFANRIRESAQQKLDKLLIDSTLTTPPVRAHHALVYDEKSGTVLMTAGSTPFSGGESYRFYNDLWRFEGNRWRKIGNAGNERSGVAMAYDSKQRKIYSFGGFTNRTSSAELRVLEDGVWRILSNEPGMEAAESGMVYDEARDRLVLFGGSSSRDRVNNVVWEWDGKAWSKQSVAGPQGRQAFAMVYDSKRKKIVVFGGMGVTRENIFGDTWEYDGTSWTKVSDHGPGPRLAMGYAYDEKRGMMIIFGGGVDGESKGDTWGWNGKAWKKLSDTGPTARSMGHMAYDKLREEVIMFGGRPSWPDDAQDTWAWDGKRWREIKTQ